MRWQWKPDLDPTRERIRCYLCGWDTDWIRYGTLSVSLAADSGEAASPNIGTAA
jgi:hypothetical protein